VLRQDVVFYSRLGPDRTIDLVADSGRALNSMLDGAKFRRHSQIVNLHVLQRNDLHF